MKTYLEKMKENELYSDDVTAKAKDAFLYKGNKSTGSGANAPSVKVAPQTIGGYDINTNFMAEKQKAEASGNFAKAKEMEYWRNQKIGTLGLPYQTTHNYNYLNPYAGQLEKMRSDIENYEPFSYDYTKDDAYIAMKRLKEKEADKAYADGYAQLSTAFDGDIPVNMINKLLTTKNDIVDSADSYIPQLRQMAYDMYNVERNDLYNQYGLLDNAAQQDYNRWSNEQNVYMQGLQNDIENRRYNQEFDYMKETDTYNRNYQENRDRISDARYNKEWDYAISQDEQARQDVITDTAVSLWRTGKFSSIDAAYDEAMRLYKRAANSPPSYGNGGSNVGVANPSGSHDERTSNARPYNKGVNGDEDKDNPKVVETGKLVIDENGRIKIIA